MTNLKFTVLKKYVFLGLSSCVFLASSSLFSACSKKDGKSESNVTSEFSKKLEGTWVSSHEPFSYVFKADGSYSIIDGSYDIVDAKSNKTVETLRESGTWVTEGENVVMTNAATKTKESQKINLIDGILFLGQLPEFDANCAECEYKSVAEYVKDMGLTKK